MAEPKDGGPAFPRQAAYLDHPNHGMEFVNAQDGMTLRDYFAAKAMAALIVAPGQMGDEVRSHDGKLSCWAYQAADAMLATRAKSPTPTEEK